MTREQIIATLRQIRERTERFRDTTRLHKSLSPQQRLAALTQCKVEIDALDYAINALRSIH